MPAPSPISPIALARRGWRLLLLDMGEIGFSRDRFVDRKHREIRRLFKLYPWEWMLADDFGRAPALVRDALRRAAVEADPLCKGALALLWEMLRITRTCSNAISMTPGRREFLKRYARKPIYSREGADIELKDDGEVLRGLSRQLRGGRLRAPGAAAAAGVRRPLSRVGAWIVGDEAAGTALLRSATPLTTDRARFVPHVILG